MRILVLNAGSSSLKASVLEIGDDGRASGAGEPLAATQTAWGSDATRVVDRRATVKQTLATLWQAGVEPGTVVAAGHRVVHGGTRFVEPTLVDDAVLTEIDALSDLAPLHNAVALDTLRAQRALLPTVPPVAVFDTAFHATLSEQAYVYPLPWAWYEDWGIRRFGFHGLSVAWSVRRAAELLSRAPGELCLVIAHLGSGCSVTAVRAGRSVSTSMGMTPLEGLAMGTRAGSVDPGILLHVLRRRGLSADRLAGVLDHESGLLGISGISGDMRELSAAATGGSERARLAIDIFVRRAASGIAVAAASLPRIDGLVFTGGIGEHAADVRAQIVARLATLNLEPLVASAGSGDGLLSAPGARVAVLRVEAREDIVIAQAAARLVSG
ncbi:MAG TPA: acetate/propionate family kinase [Candidatus Limnocylindrales bacterium]|nr:acetate/propionate family kinase [Candidatus Limnocylindrales bacterium]